MSSTSRPSSRPMSGYNNRRHGSVDSGVVGRRTNQIKYSYANKREPQKGRRFDRRDRATERQVNTLTQNVRPLNVDTTASTRKHRGASRKSHHDSTNDHNLLEVHERMHRLSIDDGHPVLSPMSSVGSLSPSLSRSFDDATMPPHDLAHLMDGDASPVLIRSKAFDGRTRTRQAPPRTKPGADQKYLEPLPNRRHGSRHRNR